MKTALQVTSTSVFGLALMALTVFWPAGTIHYWQAWVFLGMFVALSLIFTAYAGIRSPEVLRRRMNAGPMHESRPVQKIVSAGVVLAFFALLVVSALDRRFGWSDVPTALVFVGDVIAAVGLGIGILVVVQNSYAAANITVEAEQTVVSTGLYGVVRHPMYFGVLVMAIGVPLALGSYWALLIVPIVAALFAVRILDVEKALTEGLRGYRDYVETVHSRLVPGVW
ncbi:MAG TPA: isoprenylcysteine carboxylmethyltransferase family protein [Mycobacterium sp.]